MADKVIRFRCSYCTSQVQAPIAKVGHKMRCPACYHELVVPEKSSAPITDVDPSKLYGVDAVPTDVRSAPERYQFYDFQCPVCRSSLALKKEDIGKDYECPECGTVTFVPESVLQQQQKSPFQEKREQLAPSEDLYGLDISGIKGTFLDGKGQKIDPRGIDERSAGPKDGEFSVYCPLCETLQYVTRDKIGTRVKCPECERDFMVYAPADKEKKSSSAEALSFEGSDVYGISSDKEQKTSTGQMSATQDHSHSQKVQAEKYRDLEKDPNLVPVVCKLCGTRMYVPISMIGQKKKCPDCYTETLVKAPVKTEEQTAPIQPTVSENDVYGVEEAQTPEVYKLEPFVERQKYSLPTSNQTSSATMSTESTSQPGVTGFAPSGNKHSQTQPHTSTPLPGSHSGPTDSRGQHPSKSRLPDPTIPGVHEVAVPQVAAAPQAKPKKKKAKKNVPTEVLDGGVTAKRVGDNVILVAPRPPHPAMWAYLFRPLFSVDVCTRTILAACVCATFLSLLGYLFLPLLHTKQNAVDAKGVYAILLVPLAACAVATFVVWARLFAIMFMSLFMSASTSAARIQEWNEDDFFGGIIQAGLLAMVVIFAAIPGVLMLTLLKNVPQMVLLIPSILFFLALFPFMLLSSLQSGGIPFTGAVFVSLFRCCVSWFFFYLWSVLFVGVPVFLWYLCPIGTPFVVVGVIVLSLINIVYPVLIGRLGWVIADDMKYSDMDEDEDQPEDRY